MEFNGIMLENIKIIMIFVWFWIVLIRVLSIRASALYVGRD